MKPECPKCGAQMIGPRLVSAGGRYERLKYVCVCGYITTRPTKDAKLGEVKETR